MFILFFWEIVLFGAGKGNRTLMASLEGWGFTIKLYPRLQQKCRDHPPSRQGFFREIKKKL